MIKQMNALERVVNLFSPARAEKLRRGRVLMENGYGNHGASRTKNSLIGWLTSPGSATQDIDLHGALLRERARDLDVGGGLARGAVRRVETAAIGAGLIPKPRIDAAILGLSGDAAAEWERMAKAEFMSWAASRECDAAGQQNFFQLQGLIMLAMLISGDAFVLLPEMDSPRTPYRLRIRVLEADRVATEDSGGDSTVKNLEGGNRVVDGIEVDPTGRVVAYWITSAHPLGDASEIEYVRVDAFGGETGMPNVLHPFEPDRPEQLRGMPFIAPIIEQLKQLERYMNSEMMANLVASMLTVFFTSDADPAGLGMEDPIAEDDRVTDSQEKMELTSGGIIQLKPGVRPETVNPMRQNTAFSGFVNALTTYIGSAIGIPAEILRAEFNSSYSASRAALLEFWREVKRRRQWFIYDVCQPIYEAWLSEAVALGRLDCPGFFDDPLLRAAWCGVEWVGGSMGQIDPLKEVNAAILRVQHGFSTREREAVELNGSDFAENAAQLLREASVMADISRAAGDTRAAQGGPGGGSDNGLGGPEDDSGIADD